MRNLPDFMSSKIKYALLNCLCWQFSINFIQVQGFFWFFKRKKMTLKYIKHAPLSCFNTLKGLFLKEQWRLNDLCHLGDKGGEGRWVFKVYLCSMCCTVCCWVAVKQLQGSYSSHADAIHVRSWFLCLILWWKHSPPLSPTITFNTHYARGNTNWLYTLTLSFNLNQTAAAAVS